MEEKKECTEALEAAPTCFVIMPFSDPDGYEKGHFRKIYDQILAPAIKDAGYTPHRVDEEVESTMIHGKLLHQLISAPMVLCDISSKNPNVLYELGIRHAFDKPVVLVQEEGQKHIFDISGLSTTEYRRFRRYDEVMEDRTNISNAIKRTAAAKDYSIMSLVNLVPAVMKSGKDITTEERISFSLEEFEKKLARIERLLERPSRKEAYYAARKNEQIAAEKRLFDAMHRATVLLKASNDGEPVSIIDLNDAIFFLRSAIIDCQSVHHPGEGMMEDGKMHLLKLQELLSTTK